MSKFKAGSEVTLIEGYRTVDESIFGNRFACSQLVYGETYVVHETEGRNNISIFLQGDKGATNSYNPKQFKFAWQPEPGDKIDVCNGEVFGNQARERIFVQMFEGEYLCQDKPNGRFFRTWQHARPIKKTHTITLEDGTKVELSEESYKALKEGVNNYRGKL